MFYTALPFELGCRYKNKICNLPNNSVIQHYWKILHLGINELQTGAHLLNIHVNCSICLQSFCSLFTVFLQSFCRNKIQDHINVYSTYSTFKDALKSFLLVHDLNYRIL